MRLLAIPLALMVGALLLLQPSSADAKPEITYIFPSDGDVLAEPPPVIRLCFANPVDITDLHLGGDFAFSVIMPNGIGLGLRIVFQRDGLGVDIQSGIPDDAPDGEWLFEWRVRDAEGEKEVASGTLHFTVDPEGSPVPDEPPESCGPRPPDAGTTPGATPSATPDSGSENGDGDDGPDILAISLITAAAVIGLAALGLVLYLVRRRIGFFPHKPPSGEGGGGGH